MRWKKLNEQSLQMYRVCCADVMFHRFICLWRKNETRIRTFVHTPKNMSRFAIWLPIVANEIKTTENDICSNYLHLNRFNFSDSMIVLSNNLYYWLVVKQSQMDFICFAPVKSNYHFIEHMLFHSKYPRINDLVKWPFYIYVNLNQFYVRWNSIKKNYNILQNTFSPMTMHIIFN